MNHIDQEAELYALGMLEDDERARVDEHLSSCEACTVLVGEAEAAVAALVDSTQQRRPERRPAWWPIGIAAAFAIASAGLLGQNVIMRGALGNDGALLATMVDSHFDHAQFQAPGGAEISAKAIYERHGKWYEILADGTPAWHVVFVRPDGTRDPASSDFARRGSASIVYLAPSTPVRTIDLEDASGRVVGSVRPAVQAEQE
jgi:anti-sigma factor RsiW